MGLFFQGRHGEGIGLPVRALLQQVFQDFPAQTVQKGNGDGQPRFQMAVSFLEEKGRAAGFLQLGQAPLFVQGPGAGRLGESLADGLGLMALLVPDGKGYRLPGSDFQGKNHRHPGILFPGKAVEPGQHRRSGIGHVLLGAGTEHFPAQLPVGIAAGKTGAGKHRF